MGLLRESRRNHNSLNKPSCKPQSLFPPPQPGCSPGLTPALLLRSVPLPLPHLVSVLLLSAASRNATGWVGPSTARTTPQLRFTQACACPWKGDRPRPAPSPPGQAQAARKGVMAPGTASEGWGGGSSWGARPDQPPLAPRVPVWGEGSRGGHTLASG